MLKDIRIIYIEIITLIPYVVICSELIQVLRSIYIDDYWKLDIRGVGGFILGANL